MNCYVDCCTPRSGWIARRYLTKEEKRKILEGYAEELENEAKAVRERISELLEK